MGILGWSAVAALIGLIVIVVHNTIISHFNRCKQAWADVIVHERQKMKIIPMAQEVADKFKGHEADLMVKLTELRSQVAEIGSKAEFDTDALAQLHNTTAGLKATFEAYPELKSADVYRDLMAEISTQETSIGAAIKIYNSNVQQLNSLIESFPSNLINSAFAKKQVIPEFNDSSAQSNFEYTPDFK